MRRGARSGRRRGVVALMLSAVALGLLVASQAGRILVIARPVQNPSAIVSLASHEWERLPATAAVAKAHPNAFVLLTLPNPATVHNCHDCGNRVQRLRRLGVPTTRLYTLPLTMRGTYGEAAAALHFARRHRLRSLLVITSAYHTRRAHATFAAVFAGSGVRIGVVPAGLGAYARPERWWFQPYDRAYVAYEWSAVAYYWWEHGVLALRPSSVS